MCCVFVTGFDCMACAEALKQGLIAPEEGGEGGSEGGEDAEGFDFTGLSD